MNRQESRDLTRQKLRSSAMRIFATHGIGGASIDRIAEDAGFSRGAFYSNYADKHMLALEVLAELQVHEIEIWTAQISRIEDPQDRIAALAGSFNSFHTDGTRALLNVELQLEAERTPAFGVQYHAYLEQLHACIADLLRVLFACADVRPPADLGLIASTMHATTIGLAIQRRNGIDPGVMLAFFLRTILAAGTPADLQTGE